METEPPLVYSQNAKPVGLPLTLTLVGGRLVLDSLGRGDEVPLAAIAAVRLTYEPRSLARRAFRTSVVVKDGRTVRFTSVTWKGLTRVEEQGPAYGAFLRALLPAIARENPGARFVAGKPPLVWYGIVGLTALSGAGGALFVLQAFRAGETVAGLLGLLIAAGGVWQVAPFVRRNRPREFSPDAPPTGLLP